MSSLIIDPSGLLSDDQVEALDSLVKSGVPMLTNYSKVFFGIDKDSGEVLTLPLSLLPSVSTYYDRVLLINYRHEDDRYEPGGVRINVTIELLDSGDLVQFSLWVVGRQLKLPVEALVSIQNHINNATNTLDEKAIKQLLEADYAKIIRDSFPSLRLVVVQ